MTVLASTDRKPHEILGGHVPDEDDRAFVNAAESVAVARVDWSEASRLVVVRIDNWFGPRWLGFSGKLVGATGNWRRADPVIPPFVPNRVSSQAEQCRSKSGGWEPVSKIKPLHTAQTSEANQRRRVARIAPDTVLVWYSGASRRNGRGALMVYSPVREGLALHYSGFTRQSYNDWSVTHRDDYVARTSVRRC